MTASKFEPIAITPDTIGLALKNFRLAVPVCGELLILPEPSIFATAASIPALGLTHPLCGQYLGFAFWKSVQPTACFVRLVSLLIMPCGA